MISDVLHDAVDLMERYLRESPVYNQERFTHEDWALLMECKDKMIETRKMLDSPSLK